jgi:hypothetical protein
MANKANLVSFKRKANSNFTVLDAIPDPLSINIVYLIQRGRY